MTVAAEVSRRAFVAGALCGCAMCPGGAGARVPPSAMQPLIGPNYRPVDADEKGIWQDCERLEVELASSNRLVSSPELKSYTTGVMQNLLGERAKDLRVYLLHDAEFNASMTPTGTMVVNTGLLARVQSEAQFAAALGHEAGHYLRRHTVARWRDYKTKTAVMGFISVGTGLAAGVSAAAGGSTRGWFDMAQSVNTTLALSLFSFNRDQESEADAYGVKLMSDAGYSPGAASAMWRQLTEERKASALARGKRYRDGNSSAVSTHPPTAERMLDLSASAREVETIVVTGRRYDDRRDAWRKAIAPLRSTLLGEQVKLNDPGASLYLVNALAQDGWDGTLRFHEGEIYRLRDDPGDRDRAATSYAQAVAQADAPAEAWRAHGYALLKGGKAEEGRTALTRYLALRPDAKDAMMVRYSLNQ